MPFDTSIFIHADSNQISRDVTIDGRGSGFEGVVVVVVVVFVP